MIPVAILAGGFGTRLMPLTADMPKALIPVDGQPFLKHQIWLLAKQGFRRMVICTGHRGDMIADAIGANPYYGVEVVYSDDGVEPLGTGGAIAKALPLLGPQFGVLYGDTYPLYDLAQIAWTHQNAITMAVRSPGRGNVKYAWGRVLQYSKQRSLGHGDAGFSVWNADVLAGLDGAFDLGEIFTEMATNGCVDGYEVTEPVYEIGSFDGLAEFDKYMRTFDAVR